MNKLASYLFLGAALSGCASYQSKISSFDGDLRKHDPAAAAKNVEPKALADGDDQVVYLFEYGTALQMAGQFKESNKAFMKVDDLTEVKDYHSISRIAGSLVLNAGMIQYKGEDYEKVLINAMEAINFLMLGDSENSMVEARRLNEKLYKYKFEAKRNYEQNPFAYYLTALLFENDRDPDNAYIQYKKTYELNPNFGYIGPDLVRAARFAHRDEELEGWQKKFPGVRIPDTKSTGEIVLIFQQGWAPVKRPNPNFTKLPKLYPVRSFTTAAQLQVENGPVERTQTVFSVQDTSIKELDDEYAGMAAMRVAGVATKAVVSDQLGQHTNPLLGQLAFLGLNAADKADLRQWTSLPATIQIAKVRLAPGKYRVRASGLAAYGTPSGEQDVWREVQVLPGRKTFINWRSVN